MKKLFSGNIKSQRVRAEFRLEAEIREMV